MVRQHSPDGTVQGFVQALQASPEGPVGEAYRWAGSKRPARRVDGAFRHASHAVHVRPQGLSMQAVAGCAAQVAYTALPLAASPEASLGCHAVLALPPGSGHAGVCPQQARRASRHILAGDG